ncbi:MAG TPA: DUF2085 domain-containing protein [Pyrinomonadaceae bacterium]|nr:DUF2085 domain-containing protein [Pyrinomonadaceae bacterium]
MRAEVRRKAEGGAQKAENGRAESALSLPPSAFSSFSPHPSALSPYFVWAVAAALVLGFVSLVVVAPAARAQGHSLSAFFLYEMFGRVCHQLPERAFQLAGYPLAVCARCTGIYFGFAAAVLFYPLVRSLSRTDAPARKWLILAAVPAALDFALGFFGVWENTHWSRVLTGALLGAVAALYVVPGLVDLGDMIRARRPKVSGRAG